MGNSTKKPILAAFDFDGTLTQKDTLLEFIRFVKGDLNFLKGILICSPVLASWKLGIVSNWKAKEYLFKHYFEGMTVKKFNEYCARFAKERFPQIINTEAYNALTRHLNKGDQIAIVSASIDNWVRPCINSIFKSDKISVLGTQIEIKDGFLTGNFSTKNCYGQEKVVRLQDQYPDLSSYELYAYGDSRGDKEMLQIAHHAFYRKFE